MPTKLIRPSRSRSIEVEDIEEEAPHERCSTSGGGSSHAVHRMLIAIFVCLAIVTTAGAVFAATTAILLYRSASGTATPLNAPGQLHFNVSATSLRVSWPAGRVFCVYDNRISERRASFNFSIEDIRVQYCDDLVYSFVGLDSSATGIRSKLPKFDFLEEGFKRFVSLRRSKPEVTLWACIGGSPEDNARFRLLIKDRKTRVAFARNSAEWLRQNHFKGLLIYWKYPGPESRVNFTVLVVDLKSAYARDNLHLSVVLPVDTKTRREGYYVDSIFGNLDVVLLDGHRAVDPAKFPLTTCSTPVRTLLRARHNGQYGLLRVLDDLTIETDDFKRAVLSVSFAGLSFTLRYKKFHRVGAAASGAGPGGPRTNQPGWISYYETRELLKNNGTSGWKAMYHRYGRCPYATRDGHWIGYENEDSLEDKAGILTMAAGLAIWDLEMDDFAGRVGPPYPLLRKAYEMVHGKGSMAFTSKPEHSYHKYRE